MNRLFRVLNDVRADLSDILSDLRPRQPLRVARRALRRVVRRGGIDLAPFNPVVHTDARRRFLIERLGIDLVIDVGANAGQFAERVRGLGYTGPIVSYEPLYAAGRELDRLARRDKQWTVRHAAVGASAGTVTLNVAANSESSSLLPMLARHAEAAPEARYAGREAVLQVRLDDEQLAGERIYLKIDTQGHEMAVLCGATDLLSRVCLLQFEASVVPLYEGETLWPELHAWVSARGFVLAALDSGFVDPRTGQLLQLDALYLHQ